MNSSKLLVILLQTLFLTVIVADTEKINKEGCPKFCQDARLLSLRRNKINKIRFVAFAHFSPSQEMCIVWRGECPSWSYHCSGMFERYGVESGIEKSSLGPWPGEGQMGMVDHLGGGVRQ